MRHSRSGRRSRVGALLERIVDAQAVTLDLPGHPVVLGVADPCSGFTAYVVHHRDEAPSAAAVANDLQLGVTSSPAE